MFSDHCQKCGHSLECMAGESAHPSNWYCPNKNCEKDAQELKIKYLKSKRDHLIDEAQKAAHAYFVECDIGKEREKAGEIYENIRTAGRVY